MKPVYLDYNSTTPVDPRVFEAMKPFFLEDFGNAGSRTHVFGKRAKEASDRARAQVAALLNAKSEEIIFTSGATESNNLALLGLARWGERNGRKHIVSTEIEHKAVLEPLLWLRESGFEVEFAPVGRSGYVEPPEIARRLRKDTLLVSVMHSNNETGVLQPIDEISPLVESNGSLLHIDAAQTFGKEVEALKKVSCDFLSASGHKVGAPKGIGILYARRSGAVRRPLNPLFYGGGQEMGLRPGTLPVPLVVGVGAAAEFASKEYKKRRETAKAIKRRLLGALEKIEHRLNGTLDKTQAHVANVCFPGVDSEALMMALRDVLAVSNGSACTSTSYTPSHVLKAMGIEHEDIASSIRISWGPGISSEEVPVEELVAAVQSLRGT